MIVQVLANHTTEDTAYIIEDYPYGFRLRCRMKVWLEHKESKGFRLVSRTTNPKLAIEKWNAPKMSTYSVLAVMGLDEQGHVHWTGLSLYDFSKLDEFGAKYGEHFDANQKKVFEMLVRLKAAYEKRTANKGT
jgi:hypothetical protein